MGWLLDRVGFVRSLLFTIPLIYLYTIAMGLASWLVSPFDPQGTRQHGCARLWSRLILATCLARVRLRGLEKLEPGKHYVYISNHQSYLDIPILFAHLPVPFRIMAKASLFPIPFLGWHLRRTGHLPIGRTNPLASARRLLQAVNYIRQGHSVVVFAEGGRSISGRIEEFKTGIFLAAIKMGAPVVPVTIAGSRRLLPSHSWHIRPGRVEVIIDSPVATAGLDKSQLDELVARVRQRIEENFRGASL
ncbi:MAG: lysophospholipid acyltransferase family protein [Terriglobia bacterium]